MRAPLTIDDYLAARMVREPFGLLDMDVPVTGADAFVITTACVNLFAAENATVGGSAVSGFFTAARNGA